jgi:glycosyltransferase involved in cell wall biosynthesis
MNLQHVTERPARNGRGEDTNGNGNGHRDMPASAARTKNTLTIVLPTRNEAGNVEPLLRRIDEILPEVDVDVVFVDDSDDETPETIERVAESTKRTVRLIHRPKEQRGDGLGGAVVEGFKQSRSEWLLVMDADLQHPPELIEEMLQKALDENADLVLASRYHGASPEQGLGRLRVWISHALIAMARLLFPFRLKGVSDPLTGYFLVRRDAIDISRLRPHGFKILLEVLIRSARLRVAEVGFEFGKRYAGESKACTREAFRYVRQLARLRFSEGPRQLSRFGLVGASGLVVNTVLLALFTEVFGLYFLVSAVLATQGSTLWNFVLTEKWVFRRSHGKHSVGWRAAMYFLVNNATLLVRGPLLVALVTVLSMNYLAANFVSLLALALLRYGLSDLWIWGQGKAAAVSLHSYDIHGLVTVASDVRLPELERFRVESLRDRPTIRVRIGKLSQAQSELVSALAFFARHTRYDEKLGRLGFGIEIGIGRSVEVVASPLLRHSPHVLYTNVVEPILRWTFVKKGYALVHAACIAVDGRAYLITAQTDTGKTTTILKTLDNHPCSFLSDDLTLLSPDGRVLMYPKPLTVSRHTVAAVKTPLLKRIERMTLGYQSRIHSRSGRKFAFQLAKTGLPVATINALVQMVVPPPKYDIERLVPGVDIVEEAHVEGLIIIQRGGTGDVELAPEEALQTLLENCEDAYGFMPYPVIAPFLHRSNGSSLKPIERAIVASALSGRSATLLKSETMDWWERLPQALRRGNAVGGDAQVPVERPALAVMSPE